MTPLLQPAVEIVAPESWDLVDDAIGRLDQFSCLVFVSTNTVDFFFDRLKQAGGTIEHLQMIAIGQGTADAVRHRVSDNGRVILTPPRANSESLADLLIRNPSETSANRNGGILIARASRGSGVLADLLGAAGTSFEEIVVYQSRDVTVPDPAITAAMRGGAIDWVTLTSPAIAAATFAMFGDLLKQTKLATISPGTTAAVEAMGLDVAAEADPYSMNGLVEAIVERERLL